MKRNKLTEILTSLFAFLFLFTMTGCVKGTDYIEEVGKENRIDNIDYELMAGNDTVITSSKSYRKYVLETEKEYKIHFTVGIDTSNLSDESLTINVKRNSIGENMELLSSDANESKAVTKTVTKTENVTEQDENGNDVTKEVSVDEIYTASVLLSYVKPENNYISASFTISFRVNTRSYYIDDVFSIFARSTSQVYYNDSDSFTYLVSDYYCDRDGHETAFDYVLFGRAPQSHVSDPEIINVLNGLSPVSDNIYEYNGEQYYKLTEVGDTGNIGLSYNDGTALTDEVAYFKVEPIVWRVMDEDNDIYLLVAEDTLDIYTSSSYKASTVRKTEKAFFNTIFNKNEQSVVLGKKFQHSKNFFSASYGFHAASYRSLTSDYAMYKGVHTNEDKTAYWFELRYKRNTYFYVNDGLYMTTGSLYSSSWSYHYDYEYLGFRPMVAVSKKGPAYKVKYSYNTSLSFTIAGSIMFGIAMLSAAYFIYSKAGALFGSVIFFGLIGIYLYFIFFTSLNWWILPIMIGVYTFGVIMAPLIGRAK